MQQPESDDNAAPLRVYRQSDEFASMAHSVWLAQDVQTRWLWPAVANYFVRRHDLYPVFIVKTPQDAEYYWAALGPNPVGAVVVADDYYPRIALGESDAAEESAIIGRAADYERRHGISLMRAILQGDRHLGRGFMSGAECVATSKISDNASLGRALEACLRSIDFWERLAARFPPRLVLNYGGGHGIVQKPLALLCRQKDIPLRVLSSGRFGEFYYWAHDEYARAPAFAAFFRDFSVPTAEAVEAVRRRVAPGSLAGPEAIGKLNHQHRWVGIARYAAGALARRLYGRLRGYRKATHSYHVWALIGQRIRARRHLNLLARRGLTSLDSVAPRRIVYLPLQVEPEATTTTWGEYAADQFALVRECALSLPADAVLVVKEHPWELGARSRSFYDRIAALPNVVQMHPKFPSLEIIRRAAAVVTICGSAAHEAAVLGVPALHFHEASTLNVLDHVVLCRAPRDFERLRGILADSDLAAESRRRIDGARYLLALEAFCFEVAGGPIISRRRSPSEAELDVAMAALRSTLSPDSPGAGTLRPAEDESRAAA